MLADDGGESVDKRHRPRYTRTACVARTVGVFAHLTRRQAPMSSASSHQPQTAQKGSPTILVIDDDAGNLLLTSMMLKNANYTCRSEKSIEQGRQALQDGGIDLVVSDLLFDGSPEATLRLLADMRADPILARIPVIVTTGRRSEEARHQILAAGAADIITKPFNKGDLLPIVKQCLDKKQA